MTTLKILLVEDDPRWLDALQHILLPPKYQLTIAKSYGEAKKMVKKKYDLAITNLCLAGGDSDFLGVEVLDDLAKNKIPCIVLTGTSTSLRGLFERYGVFNVFIKGEHFNQREFLLEIEKAIKQPSPSSPKLIDEYVDFELVIDKFGMIHAHSNQGDSTAVIKKDWLNLAKLTLALIDVNQTNEGLIKEFGKLLYSKIFPDAIHTHFYQTQAVAQVRGQNIRIRLTIQDEELASFPLEFAYIEDVGNWLSTNPKTAFSRYINVPMPRNRPPRPAGPLHLLVIISAPSNLTGFDEDAWEERVTQALEIPLRDEEITIEVIRHATIEEINRALLRRKPDIIQFIGHGTYKNGRGYLALVDHLTDKAELMNDEQFSTLLLGSDDQLGLVCLTACESAKGNEFFGLAPKIVQKGVPAVIAMQYSVQISSAAIFLENFYQALASHKPIDWAMQAGRRAIAKKKGYENREFATPVLFMRAKDGNIF
jgi:CheY-like chemotaxis protein